MFAEIEMATTQAWRPWLIDFGLAWRSMVLAPEPSLVRQLLARRRVDDPPLARRISLRWTDVESSVLGLVTKPAGRVFVNRHRRAGRPVTYVAYVHQCLGRR
jgi:hypothetical protein